MEFVEEAGEAIVKGSRTWYTVCGECRAAFFSPCNGTGAALFLPNDVFSVKSGSCPLFHSRRGKMQGGYANK